MNINSNSLVPMNNSEGAAVYTAALSKSHQKLEGQAALALLQASAQVTASLPSSPPSATLGANVDVWV